MTTLGLALDDYLRLRRALGFRLLNSGRLLADFVGFCDNAGAATITTDVALAWAVRPLGDPGWSAQRLGVVRGFAKWLQALDPSTEVPPTGLLPGRNRRATPYLYSSSEISSLLEAARGLHPPLRAATYETFFGLLATTGMRVGEAIRLDRSHLSLPDGLLTIYGTKFNKSRQLPLHPSTVEALRAYERRRDELCPRATAPSFFVGTTAGTRLAYSTVAATFSRLVPMAGIVARSSRCRPRMHDLRHSFAVVTLLDWYRCGSEVQPLLPLLSTYLGHADPKWTYWYLSASPELLALAADRLQATLGSLL
jgi:integrase